MIATSTTNNLIPSLDLNAGNNVQNIQSSLIELFGQICSVEQMELCQKLGLLSKSEQQQAYKMAKALIENKQIPVTREDWSSLTEWVLMLRDRYTSQLESQSIQQHASDLERIQHLEKVQQLSATLEEYGQAHEDLADLIQALRKLRNDWKHRKKDVENIVLSILSSSQLKNPNYRVIKITRSHLTSLGLGLSSINKYYIIYENSLSEEERKEILNQVAGDFSMVFQENAAQNLARMAGTYHRIFQEEQQDSPDVLEEIQKLSQKVYITRPKSILLPYPTSLPPQEEGRRRSTFVERRKSIILIEEDNSHLQTTPMLFNMAKPLFEPAGWDWPHILKLKRCRNNTNNLSWCNNKQDKEGLYVGVWSTSISRLSDHFTKVGQDYYSNMLNNARLMHSHRSQMFEFATHTLMKLYRALQLEQGCANLSRTLVFLYRLQQDHPH